MGIKEILEFNFLNIGSLHLNLLRLIIAISILIAARIVVWMISRFLNRYFHKKEIDPGRRYAFSQFLKYIVYTVSILMALEIIGISLSVLWGGAAALLIGIGLGIQQTFHDLVSGIILLIEGTIEVDDVIEVDGTIGIVTDIGIRTSKIETRDKISLLVPNSKLVGDKATNWSHTDFPTRFQVKVGVAYSSDIDLVTELLLQAAKAHPKVLNVPPASVQFNDFGNSSLDFILFFYSKEYMRIEVVKSELRYEIVRKFRQNNIEIPFPQRDLWLRSGAVSIQEV